MSSPGIDSDSGPIVPPPPKFESLARSDSEIKARTVLSDVDPWTAWFYKPHTLIFSFIGAALLVWASGALQSEEHDVDPALNTKRGVWAVIAVFLGYCLLQAPATILVRPHPAFWRFIHGIAVVYLVFLTFLLFQDRDGARQFLKHLHPDLGVELKERSYGTDCRIYTPERSNKFSNVYDTLFDEYVVAHTIGWWCKAITIRNEPFLWVLSIAFEFAERSFIHMLPNFNECWWDSFVLDVLICNWFGIWAGMKTVKYFDGKTYNWVGVSQQKTIIDKARRALGQFTPAYWDKDEWNALQGPWRFLEVLACGVVFLSVEVMGFFLKFILWIPPLNPLNSYRLAVWWMIANPAIREYNMFLQASGPAKLGAFCWLGICLAIMEFLVCVKFGRGLFPAPVPSYVIWFWSMVIVALVLFLCGWTYRNYRASREKKLKKSL
jgi:phosphatidylserine synthase 2